MHFCRHRRWLSSISSLFIGLLLLPGCVESPQPDEFAGLESIPSELNEVAAESEPAPPLEPEDDGWKASPSSKLRGADDTVEASAEPAAPAEPPGQLRAGIAKATSLIPGSLGDTLAQVESSPPAAAALPAPERLVAAEIAPLQIEPTPPPEKAVSLATVPRLPAPVVPSVEPPAPAAPTDPALTPLATERPRSLIVISPKKLVPTETPAATLPEPRPSLVPPAVVLPPSTSADPGSLAKVDSAKLLPAIPSVPSIPSPPSPSAPPEAELPAMQLPTPEPARPATVSSIPPDGFTAMFNGQDLTGWSVHDGKSESWKFVDGAASCVAPGGGWLLSDLLMSDFELQFEYRLSPGSNSGVSLRFPGTGNPSLEGLEIQLLDDRSEKYQNIQPQQVTGSLYFAVAPQVRDAAHPAGEWNQCTLVCEGSRLKVTINGQLVNSIDLDQLTKTSGGVARKFSTLRSPVGSIALQSHVSQVDFRNVFVKDLTQVLASGVRWLDLVPGSGDPVPAGATVTVHYIGNLKTGKKFASSVDKGKPTTVPLKDVIPGWREGIPGMKVGGKRRLIVPSELGYGAKGFKEIIPPNSTLVYEIELLGFEKPQESLPPQSAQSADTPATK